MTLDIIEIRLNNIRLLAKEAKTLTSLAERAGTSAPYLSDLLSINADRKPGHKLSRRLEEGMGKPPSWLDKEHINDWLEKGIIDFDLAQSLREAPISQAASAYNKALARRAINMLDELGKMLKEIAKPDQ